MQIKSGKLKNLKDVRWEPLYDTYSFSTGALTTSTIRFFSSPISATKTKNATNLVAGASLPSPQVFRCFGIHAEAFISDRDDFLLLPRLLMGSYIRFFVGSKDYAKVPFARICGGLSMDFNGADTATGAADLLTLSQLGKPSHLAYRFPKDQFVDIASTENFGLEWVINITSHTISTALDVKVYLDGFRGVDVR